MAVLKYRCASRNKSVNYCPCFVFLVVFLTPVLTENMESINASTVQPRHFSPKEAVMIWCEHGSDSDTVRGEAFDKDGNSKQFGNVEPGESNRWVREGTIIQGDQSLEAPLGGPTFVISLYSSLHYSR
jgi:hypothetical protein